MVSALWELLQLKRLQIFGMLGRCMFGQRNILCLEVQLGIFQCVAQWNNVGFTAHID